MEANTLVPLVLIFHGILSNPDQIRDKVHATPALNEKKWIGVYPEGKGLVPSWNGAGCCAGNNNDDVAFIRALVDKLAENLCVDRDNVFAAGFSNGAFMTHRLACKVGLNSDGKPYFKGFVTHSGLIGLDFECAPVHKVPVLSFHATDDPVVGFNGTQLDGGPSATPIWHSFFDTARLWETHNECGEGVESQHSETTTCKAHTACGGVVPNKHCWITGGLQHNWAGGPKTAELRPDDIRATDEMFTFFESLRGIDGVSLLL